MKTPRLFALFFLLSALFAAALPGTAKADIALEDFYEALDPYGEWIEVPGYGSCWQPSGIGQDWAPYTEGYWAYTDAGWTWVSHEAWGGICFHYGRWMRLRNAGWCWVPGLEWGPAWVSWRFSDQTIGWAPLPPEARFYPRTGISVWADTRFDIGPAHYNFCDVRHLGAPVLREVIYPRTHNITLIVNTVNVTNITYNTVNHVIYCGGPHYDFVESRSQRPIPALKLLRNSAALPFVGAGGGAPSRSDLRAGTELPRARQRGNALEVFAPAVSASTNSAPLKPSRVGRAVEPQQVSRGWQGIDDPGARAHLRELIKKQGNGETPETAPAKPVQRRELKAVPQSLELTATPKPQPGRFPPPTSSAPAPGTQPPIPGQPQAPGIPAPKLPPRSPVNAEPVQPGQRVEAPGRSPGNRANAPQPTSPSRPPVGAPAVQPSPGPSAVPGRPENPPIGRNPLSSPRPTAPPVVPGALQNPPNPATAPGNVPEGMGRRPFAPTQRPAGTGFGSDTRAAAPQNESARQREAAGQPELRRSLEAPRKPQEPARPSPEAIRPREFTRQPQPEGASQMQTRPREIQQPRPAPLPFAPAQTLPGALPESGANGKSKRP
jgi:hypothetical protein